MARSIPSTGEPGSLRIWFASRTTLTAAAKLFFANWKQVSKTLEEEQLHDLRVASRRLREALALFEPCFPSDAASKLSKRVRKVTRMLGPIRNADEARLFFLELKQSRPQTDTAVLDELLRALEQERGLARSQLAATLRHPRERRQTAMLLDALHDRLNLFRGQKENPFLDFRTFAEGALTERAETLAVLLPSAAIEGDPAAQHRLRIAVKKMRYRVELVEPQLPSAGALRDKLKSHQEVLGKLHDLDVFTGMVRERVADGAAKEELLGVMEQLRHELFTRFLELLQAMPLAAVPEEVRLLFPRRPQPGPAGSRQSRGRPFPRRQG
ncbi:CHAD domain-containing protein [Citrifermentans bremense]|uniref:CHAD domain-containing protein n=1 Tax=Citrifermentans bremense TaxID=60035 RepID=UPI000479A102|nr:CHAD domain-containing protein [Citrifermentans bremense]